MEVKVIGDAVCAHWIIPDSQRRLIAYFEDLEHKYQEFIWQNLREASVREEKEQGVCLANWVLVEENWMLALGDLVATFSFLAVLFGLFSITWLIEDHLIFQINVEHDKLLILLQDIWVYISTLEHA